MTAPVDIDVDPDELDIDALTLWLRGLGETGVVNWQPIYVKSAMVRLLRALNGNAAQAIAYLEHMARENRSLLSWVNRMLSDEQTALEVIGAVGVRPTVEWPAMPGRVVGDVLTFDELIDSALVGTTYDRILTANHAQALGLNGRVVYCALHDQMLTFREFTLVHLSRSSRIDGHDDADVEIPAPRGQSKPNYDTHSRSNVKAATADEVIEWNERKRRERGA